MPTNKGRTLAQNKALALAAEHGCVVIGKGFGRDQRTPEAITVGVYVKLVGAKLLTPYMSGAPYDVEVLRVSSGKAGYLTEAGRKAHEENKK